LSLYNLSFYVEVILLFGDVYNFVNRVY